MGDTDRVTDLMDTAIPLRLFDQLVAPVALLDAGGRVRYANPSWTRVFGEDDGVSWSWLGRVPDDASHYVRNVLSRAVDEGHGTRTEFDVRHPEGALSVFACSASLVRLREDDPPVLLLMCWDITEHHRNEERLAFMAGHDPLTGLANRRSFEEALGRAVFRAGRGSPSTLLLLDLDNLKRFNDTRGHLDGDQALVNLSLILRTHVRAGDLPARIGGDEFAILFEGTEEAEAIDIAERIRRTVAENEFVDGARENGLGISGGIVAIEGPEQARTSFDKADAALYAAKASGRSRVVAWRPEIGTSSAPERLAMRVSEAFATDGFHLVFQPIVRLADGEVIYFESFVRMHDDAGHVLSPSEFLPHIERLGLSGRLTDRVVDLALWHLAATPSVSMSVNIGSNDLVDEQLLERIERILGSATSAHGRLLFEISEQTLLSHLAAGRRWMDRLSRFGCRFVLDDFGTGMGMFVLLRERHIEHVKLSEAAVRAMIGGDGLRQFVSAIREVIEGHGKAAVAAYCESGDLLGEAERAGFQYGQGYAVSEPSADLASMASLFSESVR